MSVFHCGPFRHKLSLVMMCSFLLISLTSSFYMDRVLLSQYLFPDAGVEKSSDSDRTKVAHASTSGAAGQQGNSDDVCVCFFFL